MSIDSILKQLNSFWSCLIVFFKYLAARAITNRDGHKESFQAVASKRIFEDTLITLYVFIIFLCQGVGGSRDTGDRFYTYRKEWVFACAIALSKHLFSFSLHNHSFGANFDILIVSIGPLRCLFRPGQDRSRQARQQTIDIFQLTIDLC